MSTKQLVVGAAGIYFAYITSGIIYEKLYISILSLRYSH